ncbi:hypothetical protein [Legionella worsleiensis]|uniref:Tryptophan synthase subunit beta like protein n=1 Tax=Legionella worsleiensis TaxID=45076 RepID=A0A0W1A423_9GAMM|nr:hypothetical protein [Legionella worsleiensis]KTD76024.1 hypothetical protein Lwor_2590 [Legionella worsleiensis]STY33038.1 Uncharacterised protein [Legionella worsleiensis]
MVYIKRDKDGRICAMYDQKNSDDMEEITIDNPEVVQFLNRCDKDSQIKFIQSDLQFIRVLEDVIDILMDKNIITITDFPQPVIDKLLARQAFRKRYAGAAGMEYNDDEEEE